MSPPAGKIRRESPKTARTSRCKIDNAVCTTGFSDGDSSTPAALPACKTKAMPRADNRPGHTQHNSPQKLTINFFISLIDLPYIHTPARYAISFIHV